MKHWHSLFDEGNDRDVYYNTLRTPTNQQQNWTTDNVEQIKVCFSKNNLSIKNFFFDEKPNRNVFKTDKICH